ncbi:hypothetical protein CONPUDRAFT_73278 [Coniophora puteana RWD-64-598 SS2]|uniref:Uncharacterized protein n=1 Tax=Coniophora puteana (strain RWD-64-598) TaxID=741705 RepID=A0A5M3MQY5_CONPW|nr:uncharacterized protein CONPUDRAFT_73278 [Coniophora puteana RWD-64-598 SS2]EIW81593.1 hypothetical protein CONPUDRAFT_73278 [Coniophora puteana RWD-64-598 SS2]
MGGKREIREAHGDGMRGTRKRQGRGFGRWQHRRGGVASEFESGILRYLNARDLVRFERHAHLNASTWALLVAVDYIPALNLDEDSAGREENDSITIHSYGLQRSRVADAAEGGRCALLFGRWLFIIMSGIKLGCRDLDESEAELSVVEHRAPPGFIFTGLASTETTDADGRRAYLGIGEKGENNLGYTWRIFEINVALGINSTSWKLITTIPDVHDGGMRGLVVKSNVLIIRCPGSEVNQPYEKVWLINLGSKRVFKLEYSKEAYNELSEARIAYRCHVYVGNSHIIAVFRFYTPM